MNHIPHIPLPEDRLTKAEKRRGEIDDLFAELEGIISGLECLAKQMDRITKAHDLPGAESAVQSIEAAADHCKTGLDYLEAGGQP